MGQHEIDPNTLPYDPSKLPRKEDVGIDGFFAVDMRVGRIESVESFLETRKPSYKLRVDFGPKIGVLQTSAQVTNYAPHELRDRLVVGAINLGVKRIAGFESQFLILGALDPDGRVRLLELPDGVEPGAPIA